MQTQFTILTESRLRNHILIKKLKQIVMFLLWKKIYGPRWVINSLVRWITLLKKEWIQITYNMNPEISKIHQNVCVLSGADTLQYALKLKKKWKITTLFAWPNISIPENNNDIFFHPLVDKIIVPSQWVTDYFISLDKKISQRIVIWPAGVEDTWTSKKAKKKILIYKKFCPKEIFEYIISYMEKNSIPYDMIIYGSFTKQEYQTKIDNAIGLIYLQESESQGLALQEAWIKDIPTLVRNRWYREYKGKKRNDKKISAPYLTEESGIFFSKKEEFEKALHIFLEKIEHNQFSPRKYCLAHLSDEVCTQLYLDIVKKSWKK